MLPPVEREQTSKEFELIVKNEDAAENAQDAEQEADIMDGESSSLVQPISFSDPIEGSGITLLSQSL